MVERAYQEHEEGLYSFMHQELYAQTRPMFAKGIEMLKAGQQRESGPLALAIIYWATIESAQGHNHKAESLLREGSEVIEQTPIAIYGRPHNLLLADTLELVGKVLRHINRLAESEIALRRALELNEKEKGTDTRRIGILAELAEVLCTKGDSIEAEKCGFEALRLLEEKPERERRTPRVDIIERSIHSTLGTVYERLGRNADSIHHDRQAIDDTIGFELAVADSFRRWVQQMLDAGEVIKAAEQLEPAMSSYARFFEESIYTMHYFDKQVHVLRVYVQVLIRLGREEKAAALARDLDQTEAIFAGLEQAVLEEVREEIRLERGGQQGWATDGQEKKEPQAAETQGCRQAQAAATAAITSTRARSRDWWWRGDKRRGS